MVVIGAGFAEDRGGTGETLEVEAVEREGTCAEARIIE